MDNSLRIITWNSNGLLQRLRELQVFLHTNHIDIALISETHFTNQNFVRIHGYRAYWTTHPSGNARGGTAIFVKQSIAHYQKEEIREDFFQATIITITYNGSNVNIGAAYCPPRHKIEKRQYIEIFKKNQSTIYTCWRL